MVCLVSTCAVAVMERPMPAAPLSYSRSASAIALELSPLGQAPNPHRPTKALVAACITIGLERFAFYLLFSLYTLWLVERHGFTDAEATTRYGVLLFLAYFTPLFGGAVADRIGSRYAIAVGIAVLTTAYGLFACERLLLWPVILLAVGAGLFKGNLTAAVGSLFLRETDNEAAVSRFYWSINLGAFPSGVVGGWLAPHYGYRWAFFFSFMACLVALGIWALTSHLFIATAKTGSTTQESQVSERDRLTVIFVLLPVAVLFFFAFHQSGSSMTLFANEHTLPTLCGVAINPPSYQSLQALFILTLAPLVNRFWSRWPIAAHHKFLLGMILCSASCLVMVFASWSGGNTGRVSPMWLVCSYLLVSIAELCVAPIGFSLISKLAPQRMLGLLMGLWLAAIAVGNLCAGLIGRFWKLWPHHSFFFLLAVASALAIPLLWFQKKRLGQVLGAIGT